MLVCCRNAKLIKSFYSDGSPERNAAAAKPGADMNSACAFNDDLFS